MSGQASSDELAARVQRLEDLQSIQQLFVDYGHHLDAGDLDAYVDLFTDDGEVLLGPLGRATGRDDIKALMATAIDGLQGSSFHLITSPMISLDGDRATATVMWTVIGRGPDGVPLLTMLGRHHDELVRDGDRWRFARRKGHIDLPRSLPPGTVR